MSSPMVVVSPADDQRTDSCEASSRTFSCATTRHLHLHVPRTQLGLPASAIIFRPRTLPFGEALRELRLLAGLTQQELAERTELSVRAVAYLERGRSLPKPATFRLLADALRLTPETCAALLSGVRRRQRQM